MTSGVKPDSLLVIVPAYNEQGAVGGVVRSVHEHVPGVPVLVIDDCSADDTILVARQAGAEVLTLPHHLGLAGACRPGYKLAYELGFQYVIRVDGDGQHDPRYIPRIFEKLKSSGCEMVIGSRFVAENGSRTGPCGRSASVFSALCCAPFWASPYTTPPPVSWASTARH